jgi:hypothetical protein
MPNYIIPPENGVHQMPSRQKGQNFHAPVGTVVVEGRKPGSDTFETIPDATFDLSNLHTVRFQGAVKDYRVTITGIQNVNSIKLTDTISD